MPLVMFDLDGTIIDSQSGIVTSLRTSLDELDVQLPHDHDFTWCIGASLWDIYAHYLATTDSQRLNEAVALYRKIYRSGPMYDYAMYDGIEAALDQLIQRGYKLVLATAKAREYAAEVVASSTFAPLIHHVYGSELDGTNVHKAQLIAHVLRSEGVAPDAAIMIGDRHHDVDGAAANNVLGIGVTYGYGQPTEFAAAHAIIHHPRELPEAIHTIFC